MITDQELDDMLSRSIAAGQAAQVDERDQLEQEYNSLIHAIMTIHYGIAGVDDLLEEIAILQQCFDAIERRFG